MTGQNKYTHIIWDWNGTLFDDVNWCISVINSMLNKRQIKTLSSVAEYQKAFCFPIINYYRNVGFNFAEEPFEKLANEYISLYHAEKSGNCKLYKNALSVLKTLQDKQITQLLLSASETGNLISQISEFHIQHYFDEILGLSNVYAASKIDIGYDYIIRKQVAGAVLIGDTEHDYEVANALGIDCVLISNGHQSKDKLLTCNVPVLSDISQVIEYLE